jgi:hypothetical protein
MGVGKTLFGAPSKEKSQSQTESGNYNNGLVTGALSPVMDYAKQGGDLMGSLLGVGGAPAQTAALDNFANSGGMQFLMKNAQRAVTSSKAAQGLLRSGSYGTALQDRGNQVASTYLNQYMNSLLDYSKLGVEAASPIVSAGQWSKGSSTSSGTGAKQGIYSQMAQAAAQAAAAAG